MSDIKMMKIKEDTHRELKIMAVISGVSMGEMVQKLMDSYKKAEQDVR